MDRDLVALRLAAEEVGLTTTEPVFFEVVAPTNKDSFWRFSVVACSLDGSRVLVWTNLYSVRRFGMMQASRWAKRLAREHKAGPERHWIGG